MAERSNPTEAASTLLAWLRERSRWARGVATPLDMLARLLGLDVATFDEALHPGVWGYLEPGEDLIFVRAGLSEAARRFTLAHEIGHAVLHRGNGVAAEAALAACQSSDVEQLDNLADETLSPGQVYNAHSAVEREANAFAVALLMPEAPFLDTYLTLSARTPTSGATRSLTRRLARRFGVSEDAALRRLQGLLAPLDSAQIASNIPAALSGGSDPDQQAAARLETPALVMAGPGSGKTSTLVARIVYLIQEQGAKPDEILALTFSRKAAAELQERVSAALSRTEMSSAPYISTIHRFCLDLLGRHGHLIGLSPDIRLASELELYFLLRQVMREAPLHYLSSPFAPDLYVRDIQQAISRAKDDLLSPAEVSLAAETAWSEAADETQREAAARQREFALIFELYQRRLSDQRAVDYGDIIALTARLLTEQREVAQDVAARWPNTLVDEYQDINRAMGALLREFVSAGCGLWAVGDADQAIYRFRGADPSVVHRFSETFPGAHVVSLVRNYRSRRTILDAASVFAAQYSPVIGREPLQATRAEADQLDEDDAAVRVATAETGEDELTGLARAIEDRHRNGRAYRDQVALLRTRRQVEQVAGGLRAHGVPTYTLPSALDREIIKRCVAMVNLLSEPVGAGLIRAGLQPEHTFTREDAVTLLREARRRRKAPPDMLLKAGSVAEMSRAGQLAMRRLGRMLIALRSAPSVAAGLCLYCFSFTRMGAQLLAERERSAVDALALRRLLDLARAYDSWKAVDADVWDGSADWAGFAEFLRVASVLRLDTLDEIQGQGVDAVRVMTAHASKGLEFPVVYLPQLANRRFPLTQRAPIVARVGLSRDSLTGKDEGLSDEASLFYVAMTRARDELVLSYARRYGRAPYTISPFLSSIQRAMDARVVHERWAVMDQGIETEAIEADGFTRSLADGPAQALSGAHFDLAELETYQRCPRQYAYRFVDNLWSPAPLASLVSRVIRRASDEVIRAFAQSRQQGTAFPSREEALALVEERWLSALEEDHANAGSAHIPPNAILEGYYLRHARATIEGLWLRLAQRDGTQDRSTALVGEARAREITVSIGELVIRGEVELIPVPSDLRQGEAAPLKGQSTKPWAVVRTKNGRSDVSPSLRDLFVEVAAQGDFMGSEPGRVVARDLVTGAFAQVSLSERQRSRLTREALEAASGILRSDFHANPDEWRCQRCPFAAACPE